MESVYNSEVEDFERFAYLHLKIKTEDGNIIPFTLNSAQIKLYNLFQRLKKEKGKIWVLILKPRQLGFSTFVQGFIFHNNYTNLNQKALTLGHRLDASNNLFEIYKRYYDNLAEPLQPTLLKSNEKKISYEVLGSENKVDTAQAGEIGRSDTFQAVHLTEYAFYPTPKQTFLGLAQGAKNAKIFIIETTANGFNDFRDRWVDAMKGKGDFYPFFISWLEFPPYSKKIETVEEKEQLLSTIGSDPIYNEYEGEEKILQVQHNATLEQLFWRRWTIDNLCNSDVTKFHQEYPTTWQEAFLSSGKPVFNMTICNKNLNEAEEPVLHGNLIPVYDEENHEYRTLIDKGVNDYYNLREYIIGCQFEPSRVGFIKIFDRISIEDKEQYIYAAGCDVAEGLEQSDNSVIKVLDRRTMKVVLTWAGLIDYDELANEIHKIQVYLRGRWFINIEAKVHGISVISDCYKLKVRQYFREEFRKGYPELKENLGTKTSGGYAGDNAKSILIDELTKAIREGVFRDPEEEFWNEALTFVKDSRGRMAAQNKINDPSTRSYDDRVMAEALMWRTHLWMPKYYNERLIEEQKKQELRDTPYPQFHRTNKFEVKIKDKQLKM